jgi:hypothetical protein
MKEGNSLARNVGALLKGRGIAQVRREMISAGYNIGQGTLHRIIAGDCGVRIESIQKLSDYFGVSVESLFVPEVDSGAARHDFITIPVDKELRSRVQALAKQRGISFDSAQLQLLSDFAYSEASR